MLFTENVLVALAGLRANIMRSLLTMLGIIIGIASVIAIMTVGNSITNIVNTTMQGMGANNLQVGVMQKSTDDKQDESGMNYGSGNVREMTDDDLITKDMIKSFTDEYKDDIKYVLLTESVGDYYSSSKVTENGKSAKTKIVGYNRDYMEFNDKELLAGRNFIHQDYKEGKDVCMVSDKLVERLYKGDNDAVIGQEIEVVMDNGAFYDFYVVGVYKYVAEQFSFGESDNPTTEVMVPLDAARKINHTANKGFDYITLVTSVNTDNNTFVTTVRDYFNVNFYSRNDAYEVAAISMASMMDQMNTMIGMIQLALSVIAGISLVVGGIGVMNIMLVSITERTKEIGTRKALGATNSSIRLQFITESVVICVIGGIIGIFFGVALGMVAVKLMGYDATVSVSSIIIAVGFSMAIGIFFGYYPANKAAKLNPIDALRYE
ncbi:ABC transporter permease [Pseudobutyrivibrio xylanivorans]|uniref:Putative ABC transport system permease protein n=1 Tax=Pseudobutyrivibrio xylanivorans DSM 14809 TaxID=1123012 RepID=A0A1M6DZN3_PSEXY|nr:ABC transporter permease [Pseudobutyrivibrio xylanivorans]SHI78609.1 putative ABC transport system permease protein [Pseudobutyrivibrio xylanivorans DSM 14809]